MVDVVVCTAGGIEEDIIKCLGHTYVGDFNQWKGEQGRSAVRSHLCAAASALLLHFKLASLLISHTKDSFLKHFTPPLTNVRHPPPPLKDSSSVVFHALLLCTGSELRAKGLNRIGNMLVPNSNYCKFEDWIMPILNQMLTEQQEQGINWTPSKVGLNAQVCSVRCPRTRACASSHANKCSL